MARPNTSTPGPGNRGSGPDRIAALANQAIAAAQAVLAGYPATPPANPAPAGPTTAQVPEQLPRPGQDSPMLAARRQIAAAQAAGQTAATAATNAQNQTLPGLGDAQTAVTPMDAAAFQAARRPMELRDLGRQ